MERVDATVAPGAGGCPESGCAHPRLRRWMGWQVHQRPYRVAV